jgi:asparagine synthase (glutamine-hydrolysing)
MCGFLTEFSFNPESLTNTDDFTALLALSKHRGPDSTLIHSGTGYQLGFNRLAILDLSENGNQPKYSPTKRYHVVFNGEIYNYKALEKVHELTHLQSTSDTEVLVHLLDLLGVEATIKQLNGMFSIAVIDTLSQDLYLIRDFAGIKPLFYGVSAHGIVAASQFDQIFKHVWFKEGIQLRPDIMKEYFGFGYMQAPNTIYENIFQVDPGTYLKITSEGVMETRDFKVFSTGVTSTLNELDSSTIAAVKDCLERAVEPQLVSDVPLATFLSGGIDSPLISAIAKGVKRDIKAYTMAVNDKDMDESEQAGRYAKHLALEHHVHHIDEQDLLNVIDAHFKNMPEPFGDYSSIPTFLITKLAKQDHAVMLSGDGGDELFWGYPRMLDVVHKRHWFEIPFIMRRPIVRLANKLKLIHTWAPYVYNTLQDWVKAKHLHIFKTHLDTFFPKINFSKELNELYDLKTKRSSSELLKWLRFNEFYGHMQRVLIKVDRMSMANSLEVRVPFLDKQMITMAWNIEPQFHKKDRELKYILKGILKGFIPGSKIQKKKQGFTVPIEHWLKKELKDDVQNLIFDLPFYGADVMDVDAIKAYVIDFYSGKHAAAWGIWHIYAWQKWAVVHKLIKET